MKEDDYIVISWPNGRKEKVPRGNHGQGFLRKGTNILRAIALISIPLLIALGGKLASDYSKPQKPTYTETIPKQEIIPKKEKLPPLQEKKKTKFLEDLCKYHNIEGELERQMARLTKYAKNRVTIEKMLTESTKYEDYFEKASELTGLDKHLIKAYVMAESGHTGFALNARSRSGAVGLAQLMEQTAKDLGLVVTSKLKRDKNGKVVRDRKKKPVKIFLYDERRDPNSIIASVKYLKHQIIRGDIILGLARYNAGPGEVAKRIARKKTDVFTELFKKGETREYIVRVLSRMKIAKDPEKYGFKVGKKSLYSKIRENARIHVMEKGQTIFGLTKLYPSTNLDVIKKANPAIIDVRAVPVCAKIYVPIV